MRPVFLVGFMGSGKSTIGRLLASQWAQPFVDTDELVEAKAGKSITRIFQEDGEQAFRTLERDILAHVCEERASGGVVATGGGAPMDPRNWALMEKTGQIIALVAPFEVLQRRICELGESSRPLAADAVGLEDLYRERASRYAAARIVVETATLSPAAVAAEISQRLAELCQEE
ncbi:MAG: shikimate kinase [Candidatus Schekmanbacteria bacterium]|nr:shikimate kinase [Candidatus Schekmanbacteria bacterium]